MAKDKSKCRECQAAPIEYTTSVTGCKLKHGVCRSCYERRAARHPEWGSKKTRRTQDMMEKQHETKYGIDR